MCAKIFNIKLVNVGIHNLFWLFFSLKYLSAHMHVKNYIEFHENGQHASIIKYKYHI